MADTKKTKVVVKNLPQSPLKLRLVADMVRGMEANKALDMLKFVNKKGSLYVINAIKSAMANAEHNHGLNKDNLVISSVSVDEAKLPPKIRFASRGRVSRIKRKRAHLNLELSQRA